MAQTRMRLAVAAAVICLAAAVARAQESVSSGDCIEYQVNLEGCRERDTEPWYSEQGYTPNAWVNYFAPEHAYSCARDGCLIVGSTYIQAGGIYFEAYSKYEIDLWLDGIYWGRVNLQDDESVASFSQAIAAIGRQGRLTKWGIQGGGDTLQDIRDAFRVGASQRCNRATARVGLFAALSIWNAARLNYPATVASFVGYLDARESQLRDCQVVR